MVLECSDGVARVDIRASDICIRADSSMHGSVCIFCRIVEDRRRDL